MLGIAVTTTSCLADSLAIAVVPEPEPGSAIVGDDQLPLNIEATHNAHPRLFFTASEIPSLRAKASSTHNEIWRPIRDYADSQRATPPPAVAPPGGDLDAYRVAGNKMIPFAFACVITDVKYLCDLAKTYLLAYADWQQWGENNWRDLGQAHMMLGNALAYDWLYPKLSSSERQKVRNSLAGWAQKMYEASAAQSDRDDWQNWWRQSYMQNHFWTNNSALGIVGLALLGEDSRAQMWIDQAEQQMTRVQYLLNGIQDGSWHESIAYQNYALTMSLPFMINLRNIQGVDILPHTYLGNYPLWRLYNLIPGTTEFILAYGNFEWFWSFDYGPQGLLRFVAGEHSNPYAEWTAQQLIAAQGRHDNVFSTPWYVFEFLYYEPAIVPITPSDLPQARTFTDIDAVVWRTGWGDDDLIFGLKAGVYGGRFSFDTFSQQLFPWDCAGIGCQMNIGHDHSDANTFYIYKAGRWLAPESIGNNKYDTSLHNTILIDGLGQHRPTGDTWRDPDAFDGIDSFLESYADTPGFDYVVANATQRYKNIAGVSEVTRHVLFVRPDYFIMLDNLVADSTHQYEWVSHFGEGVSLEGNWVRGNAGDGQILGVAMAASQPFTTTTGNDGQPYVRIRPQSPVASMRFVNLLFPTDDASWSAKPNVSILADTGEALAVRVQMNDGSGRTDDILLAYGQSVSASTIGPYDFDGQVAIVTRRADGSLEKIFVYGGTFLSDQVMSEILVTNLVRNQPFEAVYSDQSVAVYTSLRTEVTLFAPQAAQLTIFDLPWPFTRTGDYISFDARLNFFPLVTDSAQ